MDLIPLPLFPEGALDASVTTTVWVGVWVVVFFSLRLGWPLSGLVVPGYLVPLLIARPASALVVGLEAVLTYLLVWVLSERLGRRYAWCSFFGRDRFFALLLASVLVRWLLDVWLLPWASARLLADWGQPLEYGQQLHSFGLVVVALTANYFWKPGLVRGLGMLVVNTAVTWALVRWLLMEYTNFSVGNLQYLYEDVAASLLASPKAYILLLTTALLASRMNLHYGWDFNGILIPALLALQWYAPGKIVASFCEAGVVLALALVVLRLPCCRRTTIEGGRKILLFFNLAFAYRLVLGFLVPIWWPEGKSTDLYGFGYLLSTLLAVRAHDFHRAVGLARGSLQVSLAGAVGGSLIGFGLTMLPLTSLPPLAPGTSPCGDVRQRLDENLVDILRRDKLRLYQMRESGAGHGPSLDELERFREGLESLRQYVVERQPGQLDEARNRLARANYGVVEVEGHYLYLREFEPQRGWGLYVLDLQQLDGALIEVPAPLDEWAAYESGIRLWFALHGGALAIAPAFRPDQARDAADLLADSQSLFTGFHRVLHGGNTLQVRGAAGDWAADLRRHGPAAGRDRSQLLLDQTHPPLRREIGSAATGRTGLGSAMADLRGGQRVTGHQLVGVR